MFRVLENFCGFFLTEMLLLAMHIELGFPSKTPMIPRESWVLLPQTERTGQITLQTSSRPSSLEGPRTSIRLFRTFQQHGQQCLTCTRHDSCRQCKATKTYIRL